MDMLRNEEAELLLTSLAMIDEGAVLCCKVFTCGYMYKLHEPQTS